MTKNSTAILLKYLRIATLSCVCLVALCAAEGAAALTRVELYQTTVPVADRSDVAQANAFQAAMKVVLVRVTGRRAAEDDAALAPLSGNARRYVQQYRAAPDSQIWVAFDGPAIERWLTQNGQPLWGHERPSTFVWLGVQGGQSGNVVTADDTSDLKTSIDAAATVRGLPLIWPSAADLARTHIDYAAVTGGSAALTDVAHRLGAEGVLIGRASGTNVRWVHSFQEHSSEYSGALEGVNRAADLYAGLFAASGALAPVDIEVRGVADLKDYAAVESYLESLTFISHVGVEGLSGDAVRFRLSTRGGIEPLQRALELNGKLQSLPAGDNGLQRFQLHP